MGAAGVLMHTCLLELLYIGTETKEHLRDSEQKTRPCVNKLEDNGGFVRTCLQKMQCPSCLIRLYIHLPPKSCLDQVPLADPRYETHLIACCLDAPGSFLWANNRAKTAESSNLRFPCSIKDFYFQFPFIVL